MTSKEEFLAKKLFDVGAIQFGTFQLRDGSESPIFLNYRTPDHPTKPGPLSQEFLGEIGVYLYGVACMEGLFCQYVAGIPQAGDPLANAVSKAPSSGIPIPLLHFWEKDGHIQGIKETTARRGVLLLIDDVITRAGAKREAIEAARNAGYIIRDVLVLTDREQGGKEELDKMGVRLHAGFSLVSLLDFYVKEKKITKKQRSEIIAYLLTS